MEIGLEELNPDPSFGSHFFQNITSLRIGYFTIKKSNEHVNIDLDWLNAQPVAQSTKYIRWIKLEKPLMIHIDGSMGEGSIIKPKLKKVDIMDEGESTGI